jgi:hypothetical protein
MSIQTQSNTKPGPLSLATAADLTGKEGYLAELTSSGANLPNAVADIAVYLIDDAPTTTQATLIPLSPDRNVRIKAKGTGSKGDILALADPSTPADKGKVRELPTAGGIYFSPGVAEEDFVDGQLVLVRPFPRVIGVSAAEPSVVALTSTNGVAAAAIPGALTSTNGVAAAAIPGALTSTNGTAAAASADLAALAAEAEKIGDDVRAVHAAMLLAQAENEKIGDDARAIRAAALLAQAEAEKIGDDVRALHAALVAQGLVSAA